MVFAVPAQAGDWVPLDGPAIDETLSDSKVTYEDAWQVFHGTGKTLYNAGRDSWGNWRVQGNQYCSEWPPNAGWDCFDLYVSADGSMVRFVSKTGHQTDGEIGKAVTQ